MSQLVLNNVRPVNRNIEVSPFAFMGVLLAFIAFCCVSYLVTSNQAILNGYKIKKLDDEQRELLDINEKSQQKLSHLTSLAALNSSDAAGVMVKPRTVIYVREGDSRIALGGE